jgi:hypothetical protein
MGQLAVPMMIGAAVGGGSKLLQGKGIGGILKGAALGGALGGATGGIGNLMSQGATGAVGAASNAGLGEGITLAPSLAGDTALSLAPTTAIGNTGVGINLANSAPSSLLDYSFNPAVQNLSQTPLSLAGGGISLPASVADQLAQGNVGNMAFNMNDKLASMYDKYGTIDNLKGAAQVASMYQPQPMQSAPAGRIEVGQAPTGAIYDALRQTGYTLPKRRETNFSLLG